MPSSAVLKSAIELLATTYGFSPEEALRLCSREVEDWPKNLTPAPVKAAAPEGIKWASKRAEEEAETLGVRIPRGFVSDSASGKVTLEDVRTFARDQGRLAAKPHATPGAITFAKEQGLDWAEIQEEVEPSGSDDKYIITDLKKFQKLTSKAKPKTKAKGAASSVEPLPSAFGFINAAARSDEEEEDMDE